MNNTIFYSNINIKEHHILLKEKKHHGIIIQNNNNYNLLVPESILIKNPLSNTLNVKYKISLDKSNTLINDFISFFECMFNQTLYIPKNTKNIKKIINNPDLYIEILSNIQNTIKEKLYVQKGDETLFVPIKMLIRKEKILKNNNSYYYRILYNA